MKGPISLKEIDTYLTKKLPGAYILSRDGKVAHYVGRSDVDLASRIKSSSKEGKGYKYFWYEYTDSPIRAYYLECEWYHTYLPPDNNEIHPSPKPGTAWKCPISGCEWT